jgi:hypothetical protein
MSQIKRRITPADLTPAEQAEAVRSAARHHSAQAISIIADIMRDTEADVKVRLQAASIMLDRGLGKPTQSVEQNHTVTDLSAQHLEALRALSVGQLPAVNAPEITVRVEQ